MKRLIRWAVGLYPPAWRRRYQEEFEALLEDLPANPQVFWNTLAGALAMQFLSLGKPVAICALLGAVLAGGASFGFKDEYLASAMMELATPTGTMNEGLRTAVQETVSRRKISEILQREGFYRQKAGTKPQEEVVDQILRQVRVSVKRFSGQNYLAVEVQNEHINRGKGLALDIAVSIREAYKGEMKPVRIYLQPGSTDRPVFPNRRNIAFSGFAVGGLAGIGLGLMQQRRQQLL
jgi:hypothetical protein